MKEWFHAVADLDPFCIQEPFSDSERSATLPPSLDNMATVSHSSSREGNTPLKDEFPRTSKFRRKHSNRAPACNSQPVFMCAEGGEAGRQASQPPF